MFTNEKNNQLKFFVDDFGLVLSRSEFWDTNPTHGIGDALYRTALFYILNPEQKELKKAIISCFVFEQNKLKIKRHPLLDSNTTSRDQVAMALVALKVNNDIEELNFILKHLPKKISKKATQTLDFYLWQKCLSGNKTIAAIFCLLTYIMFLITIPLNKLIRHYLGFKSIPPEEWKHPGRMDKKTQILSKALFPTYAFFILVWQIFITPNNIFKTPLKKLLLFEAEKSNYVIRGLLGEPVKQEYIDKHITTGFRWASRLDRSCLLSFDPLPKEQCEFNNLELDMLKYVAKI